MLLCLVCVCVSLMIYDVVCTSVLLYSFDAKFLLKNVVTPGRIAAA